MIQTIAVSNYRSIRELVIATGALTVITGANGSGKSNLYRSLRLLARCAEGDVVAALAAEGGLQSCFWAGPERISGQMRRGEVPVTGTTSRGPRRLRLGFGSDSFSYAIELGVAPPSESAFALDPEIKSETIFSGARFRPATALVRRRGSSLAITGQPPAAGQLPPYSSMFDTMADPEAAPELLAVRDLIRSWRFYDHFRTDTDSPVRQPQLGTRSPVLHHDGGNLAAAVQTIRESGDGRAFDDAVDDAFPGATIEVDAADSRFVLQFRQSGLLRPLTAAELSDGTLRFLCWAAALLTPRPPALMVLNEPETSLHPDLLPALGRLIARAAQDTQIWAVSHSERLVAALTAGEGAQRIELSRDTGETVVPGAGLLDVPAWSWPPD